MLLAALAIFAGVALWVATRRAGGSEPAPRSAGLAAAAAAWAVLALAGAVPFWAAGAGPVAGLFEAVACVTTSGPWTLAASPPPDEALVLWRAVLQWGGGLASVVVMVLVFLPMGLGGTGEAGRSSLAGPARARAAPGAVVARVALVFAGLTLACGLLLWAAGLGPGDAVLYALSAPATGGDPKGVPSAGFGPGAEAVLALFMLAGATSFLVHGAALRGRLARYATSREMRLLAALVVLGGLFALAAVPEAGPVRAFFLAVSMATTSGIVPDGGGAGAAPLLLLALVGGSVASSAGGVGLRRAYLAARMVAAEARALLVPHGVRTLKYGASTVDPSVGQAVLAFLVIWGATLAAATVLLAGTGFAFERAIVAATAALTNTGPGMFVLVDAGAPVAGPAAQGVLAAVMLLGRLEVLGLLAVLASALRRG